MQLTVVYSDLLRVEQQIEEARQLAIKMERDCPERSDIIRILGNAATNYRYILNEGR